MSGRYVKGRVSIVVPNYNQLATLPATVDHVLNQDWGDLEVIIVDGGSTDGTKEYLAELAARVAEEKTDYLDHLELTPEGERRLVRKELPRYPRGVRLEIVSFPGDIGATETYNEGFRRITGEFTSYVVGDDIPQFNFVRRLAETLESSGADFVYADAAVFADNGELLRVIRAPEYSFERCLAEWYHLGVSHLYRSQLHDHAGGFDPAYHSANDYDLYLRFAQAGCRFVHLPEVLYSIRFHGQLRPVGQHTSANYRRLMDESIACALRARAWLAAHGRPAAV